MNVKFINLSAKPQWKDKWEGLFVYVTGGDDKGLYFGQGEWHLLSNVAQDTAAEIHSASIDENGVVSFFNSTDGTGTSLLTLNISTYVSGVVDAKIGTLDTTEDVQAVTLTAATDTTGAKLVFNGVKEENGVIAAGGLTSELQFAKVATTGAAADVTLGKYEYPEGTVKIAEGTTVQSAVETLAKAIADDATAKQVKLYKGTEEVTELKADGSEYTLKQGDATIFTCNIEKDSFVKEGEVVYGSLSDGTFTAADNGSAYLHLVIGTADAKETDVYIAAADLVKQISGTANEVVVTNGVVSLAEAVKTSLGLADTAIQSVNGKTKTADNAGAIVLGADDIEYTAAVEGGAAAVSVKAALDTINGAATVDGSIAKAVADAVSDLKGDATGTGDTLGKLEDRIETLETADAVVTTVAGDTTTPASGVKVTVADGAAEGSNDHAYTVGAELVWLDALPE